MSKIYTKAGDDGTTGLLGSTQEFRVYKHNPQIAILGTVDEACSWIGFVRSSLTYQNIYSANQIINVRDLLDSFMSDMFEIGTELSAIHPKIVEKYLVSTITDERVSQLETMIDVISESLPQLKNFILPTGSRNGSKLFIARTLVRKLEREAVELKVEWEGDNFLIRPEIIKYLNRLSDLLFVLARRENEFNNGSVEWKPGKRV